MLNWWLGKILGLISNQILLVNRWSTRKNLI